MSEVTGTSAGERRLRAAFDAHGDRILRVLSRSGLGEGDAEDVRQDALCVLAARLGDVPEHAERAFLVGTALRMASALKRSAWQRRVTEPLAVDFHAPPECLREEDFDTRSGYALLPAALAALPEEERSVFVLGELEELTRAEVARVLSLPEGTVATRLARARGAFVRAFRCARREATPAPGVGASALDWEYRHVGALRYENNCYGSGDARGHYAQRLVTRRRDGRTEVGWRWRWPGLHPTGYAFPEVVAGWKPWRGEPPTDRAFPLRLDRLRKLELDYGVDTVAHGSHSLAADLWLTARRHVSTAPDADAITTELMVMFDHSRGLRPQGSRLGRVSHDGLIYELWRAEGVGAAYRAGRGWRLLSLVSEHAAPCGSVDLGALLAHLVRHGLVPREHYVASVELGNEIQGGTGTTFVTRFDVNAK